MTWLLLLFFAWVSGYECPIFDNNKPTIAFVSTGGTIAGEAYGRYTWLNYQTSAVTAQQMIDDLSPEIGQFANVFTVQFGQLFATRFSFELLHNLTLTVERALNCADAAVVCSGTNTAEEAAYWLDLTVQNKKPVVYTSSMRPWTVHGGDAKMNLFSAILIAASKKTWCFGTIYSTLDQIFLARDVTKFNTLRVDTFTDLKYGLVGYVDAFNVTPQVHVYREPLRFRKCESGGWLTPFDLSRVSPFDYPRVEIIYSYADAGGEAITAFAQAGVEGIVTAGTGNGLLSPQQNEARQEAITNHETIFVVSARVGSGSVYINGTNIIPADDLTPQKARMLFGLCWRFFKPEVSNIAGCVQRMILG